MISICAATAGLVLLTAAGAGQADENPEELARLIKNGELMSWDAAGKRAKELHPGGRVSEIDLDTEWTR